MKRGQPDLEARGGRGEDEETGGGRDGKVGGLEDLGDLEDQAGL